MLRNDNNVMGKENLVQTHYTVPYIIIGTMYIPGVLHGVLYPKVHINRSKKKTRG